MAKRPSPHSFMAGMSILSLTVGDNVYAAPGRNAVFAGHEHNYYREIRDDNGDGLQLPTRQPVSAARAAMSTMSAPAF